MSHKCLVNTIADLAGPCWTLQKQWSNGPAPAKPFTFKKPGIYNQVLIIWDVVKTCEIDRWSRLELFCVETNR